MKRALLTWRSTRGSGTKDDVDPRNSAVYDKRRDPAGSSFWACQGSRLGEKLAPQPPAEPTCGSSPTGCSRRQWQRFLSRFGVDLGILRTLTCAADGLS